MNLKGTLLMAAIVAGGSFSPTSFALAAKATTLTTSNEQDGLNGKVTDSKNQPIVGATVVADGMNAATVTDFDGNFTLNVPAGTTVTISFLGYEHLVTKIADGGKYTLKENDTELGEVVVVGYGQMRKSDITSSITSIGSDDLNKSVGQTPADLLQGKVPGLVISTSSDPNASASVTLRGASTLRTGQAMEPYYIIDGVPGVDISLVSPSDIETIDVLRDATATAIYGSKAANGVIIITTRKGKMGTAHVNYDGYVAVDKVSKKLDMMTASEMREFAEENGITLSEDEGADTDWQDEVERTAISHNHNVSVSGGSEAANYMVSLNYSDRQGVLRGTDRKQINGRALAQSKVLHDKLSLSLGVNGSQATKEGIEAGEQGASVSDAMLYYSPLQPVKTADGKWYENSSASQYYNPLSLINEDTQKTVYRRLQMTGKADLEIINGLTWTASYSYMVNQQTHSEYHSTESQLYKVNGQATRNTYQDDKKVFETYINYAKAIAERHRLTAMVGYSWEESNTNDGFGLTVKDFYNDAVKYYNLTYANKIDGIDGIESGAESTLRMISFYGRLGYSFDGKYNLQATVRRDGSSAFGANNRWATFPSVSAAWRISEEDFLKDGPFSDLKVRVGYGVSGNSLGFDAYTAIRTYGQSGWFDYTDASGVTTQKHTLAATNNSNPDLKWERTGMFNVGLDFSILDGRLGGTVEYYDKETSDLIYYYPVSTNRYPYGTMTANVGDISNKGIEISINATPVKSDKFEWQTSLNLSHNKNEVKKLSNETFSVKYQDLGYPEIAGNSGVAVQRLMEGCPIGQFYTYEWAGYDADGVSQFYVHDEETGERTDKFTTKPQDSDRTKTGSAQPKLTLGWNNTLTLGKFSLNAFFAGVFGNDVFNALRAQYNTVSLISQGKNVLSEVRTNQKMTDVNAQMPSDRYIENGSYLRLQTLTLSYNHGAISDWVSNLTVYATVNNAFTITGYEGADPEVSLGGLTPGIDWRNNYYPRTRTFMVGLKVNL